MAQVDRASWMRALDQITAGSGLSEDEQQGLARKLDAAIAPFEGEDVQTALEFTKRLERDGEDSALAWLQEQQRSAGEAKDQGANPTAPLGLDADKQSITRSRSRSLRGPPK
ncbi:MAG: hypothetical protein ACRECQ_10245 [Burkholderiaceae bacterium]